MLLITVTHCSQPLTPSELIHMVGKYVESNKEDSDSDKDSHTHSNEDSDMSDAEEDNTEEDNENDFEFVSKDLQSDLTKPIETPSAFKVLIVGVLVYCVI